MAIEASSFFSSSYSSSSSSTECSSTKSTQAISGPMGTQGHCSECKGFTLIGNPTGSRKICSNCGYTESAATCPDCGKIWQEGVVECYHCHTAIPEEVAEPVHKIEHKVVDMQMRSANRNSVTVEEKAKLEKLLDSGFEILRSDVVQESSSTYARIVYILRRSTIVYEIPEPEELPSRSMEL